MIIETPREPAVTPLRYPGGKGRLTAFLRHVLAANNLGNATYIEPYAGGAGAALAMLTAGDVDSIVINDLDPAIHAFWFSAVHRNRELYARVSECEVSLEEWHRQREIYKRRDTTNLLELGFATLYLNRTNRSGVLNAGVIGGQSQSGTYRVGSRFYRETLLNRLNILNSLSGRITVTNFDGTALIERYAGLDSSFFYIDPPYFDKGSFLYMNSFIDKDHARLAQILQENRQVPWVLTYDDAPQIRDLFSSFRVDTYALKYSAHKAELKQELIIFSDDLVVPAT